MVVVILAPDEGCVESELVQLPVAPVNPLVPAETVPLDIVPVPVTDVVAVPPLFWGATCAAAAALSSPSLDPGSDWIDTAAKTQRPFGDSAVKTAFPDESSPV